MSVCLNDNYLSNYTLQKAIAYKDYKNIYETQQLQPLLNPP